MQAQQTYFEYSIAQALGFGNYRELRKFVEKAIHENNEKYGSLEDYLDMIHAMDPSMFDDFQRNILERLITNYEKNIAY